MKFFGLAFLFLLFLSTAVDGQTKCTCYPAPFTPNPPCFNQCTSSLLANATREELRVIVGLRASIADRIVNWIGRKSARTLQAYRAILTQEEITYVKNKINSLNRSQLEYFTKSPAEKEPVRTALQNILGDKPGAQQQ